MERLGYKRLSDFLADHPNGVELTNLYAYLQKDDEIQTNRLIYAIVKAFNGDKKQANTFDGEEIIDTTKPDFAEKFKGFTGAPGRRR